MPVLLPRKRRLSVKHCASRKGQRPHHRHPAARVTSAVMLSLEEVVKTLVEAIALVFAVIGHHPRLRN